MSPTALTTVPGVGGSAAVRSLPVPPGSGDLVVRGLLVGVCGTDREIVGGAYGIAPPGADHLVLGHESLGEVLEAPPGSRLRAGDLVVGIVRRPDPVPCGPCGAGEWDMCRNGLYTERGIKGLDGFASTAYRIEDEWAVPVDRRLGDRGVLVEPTSVVAKAWEHIAHIGARAAWSPRRSLVTGAGLIGLLAALLAVQRGLDTHVVDVVTTGPKPALVSALGATYHSGGVDEACADADIVVECTGVAQVVLDVMRCSAANGIVCLTGLSSGRRVLDVDARALNRSIVLENDAVFGSVNANRRHYLSAADALLAADPGWLDGLITRRVPLGRWQEALRPPDPHDVKIVIDLVAD